MEKGKEKKKKRKKKMKKKKAKKNKKIRINTMYYMKAYKDLSKRDDQAENFVEN